jgi:CheY-like chemotaxis protein
LSDEDEKRSVLAHDLKTPLAVIAGYAELLERRADESFRREAAARILEAVERLRVCIDELLDAGPPPALVVAELDAPHARRHGPARIALVDDYGPVRSLLRATFPPGEYEVFEADDGAAAISLVERERPDLVILDWNLPERSGAEVLAHLRRDHPQVCIVVLSAQADAAAEAADAFLVKPFSPAELLDVVETVLSRA